MQSEIIVFNKKYKTVQVFFGIRFSIRSTRGLKWITLDEYGMNNKIESKKSTPTFYNQGLNELL
ncbi:hypothetical protein A9G29_05290 [Gilliamella sp. Fer2-1]|jgi:hypothetical protein|nr:hypothetical protein A9G29_05290 [Gilliamella apicola]